jgi:hypothetical protein
MTESEKGFALRWYGKKYGLTISEAQHLYASDSQSVESKFERWREEHGLPATNSPLARSKLLEFVKENLDRSEDAFAARAAASKIATSGRLKLSEQERETLRRWYLGGADAVRTPDFMAKTTTIGSLLKKGMLDREGLSPAGKLIAKGIAEAEHGRAVSLPPGTTRG